MNNYQLLDQFQGMKCGVGIRLLTNSNLSTSFIYQSFTYYLEDGFIYLEDNTNNKEAFTHFPLSEIKEIKNLYNNDLYHDVISFKTDEYIVDIGTLEEPFIYPKCHRCGSEIHVPEAVTWHVLGYDCYENPYDGDSNVINSLNFCSNCIQEFVGNVENSSYFN